MVGVVDVSNVAVLDLADLAAVQWGLFTTAHARRVGLNPQQVARLAGAGAIERLHHGIYRIGGAPADRRDELRAAWLNLQPSLTVSEHLDADQVEVVSHRSAAWVRELGDIEADLFEFTATGRKRSRRSDVRLHRRDVSVGDWSIVDGLPVTTAIATIRDLADSHLDGSHLAGVVSGALIAEHLDLSDVAQVLRPYARRYGAALGDGDGLLRRFLEEAGVPANTIQLAAANLLLSDASPVVRAEIMALIQRNQPNSGPVAKAVTAAWPASQTRQLAKNVADNLEPVIVPAIARLAKDIAAITVGTWSASQQT